MWRWLWTTTQQSVCIWMLSVWKWVCVCVWDGNKDREETKFCGTVSELWTRGSQIHGLLITHEHESVLYEDGVDPAWSHLPVISSESRPRLNNLHVYHPEEMAAFPASSPSVRLNSRACLSPLGFLSEVSEWVTLWERGVCVWVCAFKLGLTTGSSHIPFPSPPLSNLLCFLLPHDCRFLFALCCFSLCSFSLTVFVLIPSSLWRFYQLQSSVFSLLFISGLTLFSLHVSRDPVKIFFSFSPPLLILQHLSRPFDQIPDSPASSP